MVEIDPYKRFQKGLYTEQLFPTPNDGTCSCGCGTPLRGRQKRWAAEKCSRYAYHQTQIIAGNTQIIRMYVYDRDRGVCANCKSVAQRWDADHIIPVHQGGGACDLDNFQTLCVDCHKAKTKRQMLGQREAISLQAE